MTTNRNLTTRELELVSLLLKGKANKQIAFEMGLSIGTVKVYLHRIFMVFKLQSRCELIAFWYQTMHAPPEVPISPPRRKSPPRRTNIRNSPEVSDEELDRRALALGV
jgi:DNA-binding CsgD family transcriptional regulator